MFYSQQRLPISWTSACVAAIGAAFCAIQAVQLPFSIPCNGTGCRLFQDFTIYGLSLWWIGGAYFLLMALLCLRRAHQTAFLLAGTAILADTALLALMLLTASCLSCLGAGFLIALLFFFIRGHIFAKRRPNIASSLLLAGWSGLFIAALAFAGTEQLGTWRIAGPENAGRRVYFAPSCPACRDAVMAFASSAAFYPVAENDNDTATIQAMSASLEQGLSIDQALETAMAAANQSKPARPSIFLRLNLLRNKAEVMRLGFSQLPLIMINGMPQTLRPSPEILPDPVPDRAATNPAAQDTYNRPPSTLPPELLDPVDSCGDQSHVPCDPPL